MKALKERIQREPALVSGLVAAVIALATAFGLELTNEQVGGVMAVVAAILALLVRQSVTPNVSVAAQVNPPAQAVAGPAADGVAQGDPVEVLPADLGYAGEDVLPPGPDYIRGERGESYVGLAIGVLVIVILVVVLFRLV